MSTVEVIPTSIANDRTIFDARARLKPGKRNRPYERFRRRVKWAHDLAWLAEKLGLEADDPRLPDIALKLALDGKLVIYVTGEGQVGDVGKPREGRRR